MSNESSNAHPTQGRRPPIHKRQYIVDKPFQYRLIGVLLSIWLANSVFFSVVLFFFYEGHLNHFYELVPRAGMLPLVSPGALFSIAIGFVLVFGGITLFTVGLYLSNQMAGPLFRMKKSLERVGRGDWSFALQFRQGDFMRDVPSIFNAMLESLRRHADEDLQALRAIEASAEASPEIRRLVRQLRERKEASLGAQPAGESAAAEPVSVAVH